MHACMTMHTNHVARKLTCSTAYKNKTRALLLSRNRQKTTNTTAASY